MQPDQDNSNTNTKGLSHYPCSPGHLGHAYSQGLNPLLPASSNGDAPLSRSPSGIPKGREEAVGLRQGCGREKRQAPRAAAQLDPSSSLSSRKIAVSFLVPKTTQQQERSCLRTRQGLSVLEAEEPAAGKAHAGEAVEGRNLRGRSASGYNLRSGPLPPQHPHQQPHAQIQCQPSPRFSRAACAALLGCCTGHHGLHLDLSIHQTFLWSHTSLSITPQTPKHSATPSQQLPIHSAPDA